MYEKRHLEQQLRTLTQHFNVIMVTGARQVGKTTLLKEVFPTTPLITFDPVEDVTVRDKTQIYFYSKQKHQSYLMKYSMHPNCSLHSSV